jgi:predicted amidophosphoribosyltransferase
MKPKAVWVKCPGEAHTPEVHGGMDHCSICMPWWDEYPTCPNCGHRLSSSKGYCRTCQKYCDINRRYDK